MGNKMAILGGDFLLVRYLLGKHNLAIFNLTNAKVNLKTITRYGPKKKACCARHNPRKTLGDLIVY
jgi:hypothetical protein